MARDSRYADPAYRPLATDSGTTTKTASARQNHTVPGSSRPSATGLPVRWCRASRRRSTRSLNQPSTTWPDEHGAEDEQELAAGPAGQRGRDGHADRGEQGLARVRGPDQQERREVAQRERGGLVRLRVVLGQRLARGSGIVGSGLRLGRTGSAAYGRGRRRPGPRPPQQPHQPRARARSRGASDASSPCPAVLTTGARRAGLAVPLTCDFTCGDLRTRPSSGPSRRTPRSTSTRALSSPDCGSDLRKQ